MRPPAPGHLREQAEQWADLSRWERAELGRALRRLGWTYSEIRCLIPVPKATLSSWCTDVELSRAQLDAIKARTKSPSGVPRDTQWRRRVEIEAIRAAAAAAAPRLIEEPLWVAGTTLYWAEGSKTTRKLALTNTDPDALRIFRVWTERYHDPQAEFVLALHLHHGNNEPAARAHWSKVLDMPDATFHKTFIKPSGTGHRKNRLETGVCRVTVRRSTDHFVRTMAWIDALSTALL